MFEVVLISLAFKLLLYAVLFLSPKVFDTSSLLLIEPKDLASRFASRLMIFDAVYFTTIAEHAGQSYEHEYAFSAAWGRLLRLLAPQMDTTTLVLTAACVSLVSHLVTGVLIARLAVQLGLNARSAALIYAVSPAGIFMISGYTESSCAALTFGALVLLRSRRYIIAGAILGLAILLRPNCVLWGILFALTFFKELRRRKFPLRVVIGGAIMAACLAVPQIVAYQKHCPGLPWCDALVPSVYTYVQAKYWNNGFLRYWTLGNLPLFLMAAPTLVVLFLSTLYLWQRRQFGAAIVQGVMFLGLVFFWHVQIVNRLSSSLPGPALYLSSELERRPKRAKFWIGLSTVWCVTQAGLYGASLPPA